jgi:hypothetical protein
VAGVIAAAVIAVAVGIWIAGGSERARRVASAPPAKVGTGVSGVAQLPGERLVVLFQPGPGGQARIQLTEDPEFQIRVAPGAATFSSTADYILIGSRDSTAVFDVRIPLTAAWVEIRSGDDRVFLKDGARITTGGFTTAAAGGYVLRLEL